MGIINAVEVIDIILIINKIIKLRVYRAYFDANILN